MNDGNKPLGASSPRSAALAPLAVAIFLVAALPATAASIITTYAGSGTNGTFSHTIGFPATNADFNGLQTSIEGLAVDLVGNLYIASFNGHQVLRVDQTNDFITSFAGSGVSGHSGDGGPATDAQFNAPQGVAVDLSGNVFVVDRMDDRVRKIDAATGIITTVAGGNFGYSGNGGPATNASLAEPQGVAVDVHGNLYIADTMNFVVRKVDAATGIIRTIAGQYPNPGHTGDGGPSTNALLNFPFQVAADASGNLFILDAGSPTYVRRIDGQTGIITTIAGGGAGDGTTGSATNANLDVAFELAVDNLGSLYLGGDAEVWKVDLASGNISIVAGRGGMSLGFSGDGGPATNALLNRVAGLAVSATGDLYLTDYGNERVRRVTPDTVPPYAVLVDLTAAQTFMTPQSEVQGRLGLATVNGHLSVVLPTDTNVTSGLFLTGTNGLRIFGASGSGTLTLPALNSFGGNLSVVDNCGPTNIDLSSLTNLGGSLTISSNCAASITVASPTVGGGVTLTTTTGAINVGSPNTTGAVTLTSSSGTVNLGNGTIGGGVTLSGSTGSITLGSPSVAGGISVSGGSGTINLGNPNVTGDIGISTSTGSVTLGSPSADGGISISTSSGTLNVGSPNVTGDVSLTTSSGTVNLGSANVNGSITATAGDGSSISLTGTTAGGNASLTGGSNSVVTVTGGNVTGNLTISNAASSSLGMSNVFVGGGLTASAGSSGTITMGSATVGGSLTVSTGPSGIVSVGNPTVENNLLASAGSSGTVNVGSPNVTGNLTVTTGPSGIVSVGSPTVANDLIVSAGSTGIATVGSPTVGGNLVVVAGTTTNVDVSGAHVTGNTTVTTTGPTNVTLSTALGSTSVTLSNGAATMQAVLPTGTFMSNVVFSVSTVPPATLPTFGTLSNVSSSVISAVAAYHFTFAIPTLNQDASLTFDIQLSALDSTNRAAFLDALNAGAATVAVLGDAPGSVMQTFPVCDSGQAPSAGGCVSVAKLDATGTPLPHGSPNEPAVVRFSGVAGHFSTWGVVLVNPPAA